MRACHVLVTRVRHEGIRAGRPQRHQRCLRLRGSRVEVWEDGGEEDEESELSARSRASLHA
eukprot:2656613-Rhodomonas_salina.1